MVMLQIQELRSAKKLSDLAGILGYETKKLAYIIYKIPLKERYIEFEIEKKNGDKRLIEVPNPRLKQVQHSLNKLLSSYMDDLSKELKLKPLAHGFRKDLSIHTNAYLHKNKRFVLNFDIQDFFHSIHFGRVRGFFIKNRHFLLEEKIATIIAHIVCYKGRLPQGGPTSPITSNLIAHIMDVRLVNVAKKYGCTYSRYADDITFSTNKKEFPADLIKNGEQNDVNALLLGDPILDQITRSGFNVNVSKTRLRYRDRRQVVTGLVVNRKVNVRQEYYRRARAMTHSYFATGKYYIPSDSSPVDIYDLINKSKENIGMSRLEGILNHIYYTRDQLDQRELSLKQDKPSAIRILYRDFLYYKYFGALEKPLVICEGLTDSIYLRLALKKLYVSYPELIEKAGGACFFKVRFLKYNKTVKDILHLTGGTGELKNFVGHYDKMVRKYKIWNPMYPVILMVDNDGKRKNAATAVFSAVKQNSKSSSPSVGDNKEYYYVNNNLYLVKMPHIGGKENTCIEDCFDKELLKYELNGKSLSLENKFDTKKHYGKKIFAEHVVMKKYNEVNFDGFRVLLKRIVSAISAYSADISNQNSHRGEKEV